MIRPEQKYARDLSRRNRSDRLLARAVHRAAKPVKTLPPGYPEEKTRRITVGGQTVITFGKGADFPSEWR